MIDYERIRNENRENYGKLGALKYGKRMSQDLYEDRTHFIYELLQNAEDALGRLPPNWRGERSVSFVLTENHLQVKHHGDPFNEHDVRAICEFDESTKSESLTEVGRFGVGFKSVYAFTDRPEIYSANEHFAIEEYIYPYKIEPVGCDNAIATVFDLPFREDVSSASDEIASGLESLNRRTLLFLKHIDEISWKTNENRWGRYLRESREIDGDTRKVTLIFEDSSEIEIHAEEWLIFSVPIKHENIEAGDVQIAYLLGEDDEVVQATDCTLFARFNTGLRTDLGVLIDGPYKTTLSRDNIPANDQWNQYLMLETASLFVDSLRWMRGHGTLTTETLCCLPLRYPSNQLLVPLHKKIEQALLSEEPFFPKHAGGYISSKHGLLAHTDDLREMFSDEQIENLFEGKSGWVDKTLEKYQYLLHYTKESLKVAEVRPEGLVNRLSKSFLEQQSDEWVQGLYVFFNPQRAQVYRLKGVPIVRLEDRTHVLPTQNGVFLPTEAETEYTTVRRSVCQEPDAMEMLKRLGLRKWDDVDDAIENILPRYQRETSKVDEDEYKEDIRRLISVWRSCDSARREKLEDSLKSTPFVRYVKADELTVGGYSRPADIFVHAEKLIQLFNGIRGVKFMDPELQEIVGQDGNRMLIQCGMRDKLQPEKIEFRVNNGRWRPSTIRFSEDDLKEMRAKTSESRITSNRPQELTDWQLTDLGRVMAALPKMSLEDKIVRAKTMWTLLAKIEPDKFEGEYKWFFHKSRTQSFPSEFVDSLNCQFWVPGSDGQLHLPLDIEFESLGWPRDDWLLTQIKFKPQALDRALEEMGFDSEWSRLISEAEGMGKGPGDFSKFIDKEAGHESPIPDQNDVSILGHVQEQQVHVPRGGDMRRVVFPNAGPKTSESARHSIDELREVPDKVRWVMKEIEQEVLNVKTQQLIEDFKNMVQGDYGKRCQICGFTFDKANGDNQVFVIHIVPPHKHSLAPHYGNLIGLCGLHYSLFQYGQWSFLNPKDRSLLMTEEELLDVVISASERIDERGNLFYELPIAFWNVYWDFNESPQQYIDSIRYSQPHWVYLNELFGAG